MPGPVSVTATRTQPVRSAAPVSGGGQDATTPLRGRLGGQPAPVSGAAPPPPPGPPPRPRPDPLPPAALHRLSRVGDQVQQDLLQCTRVAHDRGERGIEAR